MAAIKMTYDDLQRVFGQAKVIKLKGYSHINKAEGEKDKYQHAKHPIVKGWQSEESAALTVQEARDWINKKGWIGMVIPSGYIIVDVDDRSEGELIKTVLDQETIKHHAIQTTNGWQFIFKDSGTISTQNAKVITWAGFVVDYRLQGRGQIVLPVDGSTPGREWITVCNDVLDTMPTWFNRLMLLQQGKTRPFVLPISEGGRNDTLFRHASRLQELGLSDEDITDTILFMGASVTDPAYEGHELHATLQSALNHPKGEMNKKNEPSKGPQTVADTSNITQKSVIDEWENPILFEEYNVPPIPAFLPDWCHDFAVEFSELVQVPLDAPYMATLSVLSAALSKKYVVHIPQHEWTERINLYAATIMPPSEKKSETLRVFCHPLHRHEEREIERVKPLFEQQKEERDAKAKRIEQLKTNYAKKGDKENLDKVRDIRAELEAEEIAYIPQFVSTDCTPEKLVGLMQQNKERMAIITAEGGIFDIMAGRYSSGIMNLDIYLNSYSGDRTRVDRQNRSEYLQEPALTFGLFVQPDVIASLPKGMERRGLLGRFMYSVPHSKVGYRKLEASSINQKLKERYNSNMNWLLELDVANQQLHLDKDAYIIFKRFWERVESSQREGGELSGILQSWAGKLSGNMLRLAALVHIATFAEQRNIPPHINGDTMTRVVEAGEYFIGHAKVAFNCMGIDENLENAKYLLNVINRQDSDIIPFQMLWQLTKKRMGNAETIKKAISVLVERGFCKMTKVERKEFIFINPLLTPKAINQSHNISDLGVLGVKTPTYEIEKAETDDVVYI